MGAIDFIISGDSDYMRARKHLVSLANSNQDAEKAHASTSAVVIPSQVQEIEDCCVQWRPEHVRPEWFALTNQKDAKSKF
jgi:hypothetical protein